MLLLAACGGGDDGGAPAGSGGGAPVSGGRTSTNWSGYSRTGSFLEYTSVSGAWIVPEIRCDTGGNTNSSTWIGIGGGATGDPTLIQAGTGGDCRGTEAFYDAWWEAIPLPIVEVLGNRPAQPTMAVQPGDVITTEINGTGGLAWQIAIRNVTQGTEFNLAVPYTSAGTTVEWIVEEPLAAGSSGNGQLPLSNFGRTQFSGLLANGANPMLTLTDRVVLVSPAGAVEATPSAPGSGGDSFDVCWGPGAC